MEKQTQAYIHALAAVLLWSTVASAFKLALRVLTPAMLLLYSAATAAAVLLVILTISGKLRLLSRASLRDWLASALMGLLNPFLYYLVLLKAYALLPGQEAQPLNFTWAIALAILAVPLLKQPLRAISFLAILISFAGVYVIATRGNLLSFRFTDPLGVALAVGSSFIWALFWILNLRDRRDAAVKLFLSFLWGGSFTLIYAVLTGQLAPLKGPAAFGALYVGLFEMGITFLLWLRALALSRTTALVSNLIFLSPFISLVLLHFIVGEEIFPSSVAGLILIVIGIAIQRRWG
jgi:drug/metabolite transporter (DMT)-like permease